MTYVAPVIPHRPAYGKEAPEAFRFAASGRQVQQRKERLSMTDQGTDSLMKTGVILAAAIIVVRIVLEQIGSPESINNIFGVAWLYFIFPALFALRISKAGMPGPFKALLMDILLFGVYTRLMVMVTYMAAYLLKWQAPRFSLSMGGNVGPDVSAVQGLLVIPARNALIWVLFILVVGMIIGSITLLVRKRKPAAPPA